MSNWPGRWHVICDVCGHKYYSDEVQKRWDGLIVCKEDYEVRHPQDFVKAKKERVGVPFARPGSEDTFVSVSYVTNLSCTYLGSSSTPGFSIPGCMIPGKPIESNQV